MAADWLRTATALALAATLQGMAPSAVAQVGAAPKPDEMIQALRPSRQRNLLVRPAAPEAAASAAASVAAAVPAPAPVPPPAPAPAPAPVALPTPAPAPALPPPAAAAAEQPPSLSLALSFDVNSARLRPESGPVLGNLVAAMLSADLKAHRFVIEGHTDASGNPATNLRLSQARADEVRLYLVALGVQAGRLRAVGKGSADPANPANPLSAENRRVRVVTLE